VRSDHTIPYLPCYLYILLVNYNLFDEFYPDKTYDDNFMQRTYLSDILRYYKNNGTTRLILFDFSCSVYDTSSFQDLTGEGLQKIKEQNKHIPSGGKFNKKSCKRKSCKRKSHKRKSHKRKSNERKSYKRKSYKKKSHKRKFYKK
jgi:hypothetical protein